MHDEGHPMLTLRRTAVCCAAGAAFVLAAGPAAAGSFGPGAAAQLNQEMASAWKISRGSGVTVAVLSTGVDPDVPGLQGKVSVGHDYVSLPYPAPVSGTLIASAIAGSSVASSSQTGRAPQAKILSIRVAPDSTIPGAQAYLNAEDWEGIVASAITEAVNQGAKVIYDSLIGYGGSEALEAAVRYAISKGVVVVGEEDSFGNGPSALLYPAALPGVLGAGTVFLSGLPPASSPVASPVDESILVAAPGNQLYVSGPQGTDYYVQNFWAAGAWLVGTAALIKSVYPDLSPALVARAIAASARDHPPGGYNTTVGFGLIDPYGALKEAATLSKLRAVAAPGPGVASPSERLAAGPAPGVIEAVHRSTAELAAFGAAIAAGLACLAVAAVLAWRWRRRPAAAPPMLP
jgi:hypothetical protein